MVLKVGLKARIRMIKKQTPLFRHILHLGDSPYPSSGEELGSLGRVNQMSSAVGTPGRAEGKEPAPKAGIK